MRDSKGQGTRGRRRKRKLDGGGEVGVKKVREGRKRQLARGRV